MSANKTAHTHDRPVSKLAARRSRTGSDPNGSVEAPIGRLFSVAMSMDTRCTTSRRPRNIPALTGLRFVAAAYVVLFHSWPIFLPSHPGPHYWNQFVSLGYTAVSFFFVLSGFILATVYPVALDGPRMEKRAFWQARFARIYPIYAVSMVLAFPLVLESASSHGIAYQFGRMAFLTISNGGLLQAWHPILSGNWNRPTWSVSVEAFFYLVFPMAVSWVARCRKHLIAVVCGLWLVSVLSSIFSIAMFPHLTGALPHVEIFLFDPLLRLPEFLIGVCFATWLDAEHRVGAAPAWVASLVCLMLVPLLVRLPWLLVSNGLLAPVFGLVIAHISRSRGIFARVLEKPLLVRLGHASFSVYLIHLPVLLWMTYFLGKKGIANMRPWPGQGDAPLWFCFYWIVVLSLSLLGYSALETPARRALKMWFARHSRVAPPTGRVASEPGREVSGTRVTSSVVSAKSIAECP